MFQIKVDVEGNEITDQAATAAVSEKKEKNQNFCVAEPESDPKDP
jgi:hypothetical protein